MSLGLIGRKIGMSQIFDEDGNVIPVTVIEAGPCYILEQKNVEKHGYNSVQLGFMDAFKNVNKPEKGYFDKIKVFPKKVIREFQLENGEEFQIGDQLKVDIFKQGDYVDIVGTTKGRGFQGSIKRHNMHRGPMSHGSHYHRSSGAMGGCADPAKVFKGKKLPGRMGGVRRTLQNLKIVDVNVDDNIILVKGSIPGANNNVIYINRAVKKKTTN